MNDLNESLDVIEFCEGVLCDAFASEDGIDVETARRVACMCRDVLVKHDRTSVIVERSLQPES